MLKLYKVLILLLVPVITSAQTMPKVAGEKPKLIIGINISNFRNDFLNKYWDKFDDNGFKKLVSRGTYCKNTQINYTNAEPGVGVASIITGTYPSDHGIVGQYWYNNLKGAEENCIADDKMNTVGGAYTAGKFSPKHLMSTSFADEINLSQNFKSKVYSVCLTPEESVLAGGHTADAAYWFDFEKGNFVSSTYYIDSLPNWANDFNAKRIPDTYIEGLWEPLWPIEAYTESWADDSEYETGFNKQVTFPYELEKISKKISRKEPYTVLNFTPYGNTLTKDFAIQIIANEELGQDDITDVLMVSFTASKNLAPLFGPVSVEVEDLVLRLDKQLAHFLEFIDATVGKENTLIFLTAEQGMSHYPEYMEANKIPTGYFNAKSANMLMKSYLSNLYGKGDWVTRFENNQVYLDRLMIEDAKLNLVEVQNKTADFLLQFEGVANALTASNLQSTNYTSGVFQKIQNGYNQKRSGDVIINLRKGWVERGEWHFHGFGNENKVPLIFYGWKVGRDEIYNKVDIIDIAPTVNALLDVNAPNASRGVPIRDIIEK